MKKWSIAAVTLFMSIGLMGCGENNVQTHSTDRGNRLDSMQPYSQNQGNRANRLRTYNQDPVAEEQVTEPETEADTTQNTETGKGKGKFRGHFSDVKEGKWFTEQVEWSKDVNIITGFPDGSFQPNKPLTRAEVVQIIKSLVENGYLVIPDPQVETPAEETPADETPADETPADETPAAETPAEATPTPTPAPADEVTP